MRSPGHNRCERATPRTCCWKRPGRATAALVYSRRNPVGLSGASERPRRDQCLGETAIKRTYQPKKKYRRKTHGFRIRMSTPGGRQVLKATTPQGP